MSFITRVLHTTTWDYFTSYLPDRFSRSLKVVKEAIMTDINDLVQEFSRTSSDEASFFAMRHLHVILEECFNILEVCFDISSVFSTAIDLAEKNPQMPTIQQWDSGYSAKWDIDGQFRAKFRNGYRKMFDQSCSKSKALGDVLRFLPGIVVLNGMSIQGMADLYRMKPDLLERLIKIFLETLGYNTSLYILGSYLSGFLQDRNRSKHYYCDPILQHISICRHFLSLLDESNAFDLQS